MDFEKIRINVDLQNKERVIRMNTNYSNVFEGISSITLAIVIDCLKEYHHQLLQDKRDEG